LTRLRKKKERKEEKPAIMSRILNTNCSLSLEERKFEFEQKRWATDLSQERLRWLRGKFLAVGIVVGFSFLGPSFLSHLYISFLKQVPAIELSKREIENQILKNRN